MTAIELTVAAERDLIDIFLYGVEHFGLVQAERYAATLTAKIEYVAEYPDSGVDFAFVRAGVQRQVSVSHAIYYRSSVDGILVLRILHGRMDPARHLA